MHLPTHPRRCPTWLLAILSKCPRTFLLVAFGLVLVVAAPAEQEKSGEKITLSVESFERLLTYPPPPAPPRVFVVSAGAGHELAVLTLKVVGSTSFNDYEMSAGATLVEDGGTKQTAILSKPYKAGSQPEVWDKHVLVFPIKRGAKLKTLLIGELKFELSTLEETK